MAEKHNPDESPHHRKEILYGAGGFAALIGGALLARGKVRRTTELPTETEHEALRYQQAAAVLLDKEQGHKLKGINRIAALLSLIEPASREEITELYGLGSLRAREAIGPLINKLVNISPPLDEQNTTGEGLYVFDQAAGTYIMELPKVYRDFHAARQKWEQVLASPGDNL